MSERPQEVRPEPGSISSESLERRHEQRDLGLGILFGILGGVIVLMAVAAGGMVVFQNLAEERARRAESPPSPMIEEVSPPSPRLESAPGQVLGELRERERVQLQSYGWVDPEAGLARIPVERAMEIIARRGGELPARPTTSAPPDGGEGS